MTNFERLHKVCMAYENKLKELMSESEYEEFYSDLARTLFAEEICAMPDSEFKEIILDNFDGLTGSDSIFQQLLDEARGKPTDIHTDIWDDYDNGADY